MRRLLGRDDDDRQDGRDLPEFTEPGSDALLLLGLLLALARRRDAPEHGETRTYHP